MRIRDWLAIAFLGAILVVVAINLFPGAQAEVNTFQALRAGGAVEAPAVAQYVQRNHHSGKRSTTRYCVRYVFTDGQGQTRTVSRGVSCGKSETTVADHPQATAIFDPADPNIAFVDSKETLKTLRSERLEATSAMVRHSPQRRHSPPDDLSGSW